MKHTQGRVRCDRTSGEGLPLEVWGRAGKVHQGGEGRGIPPALSLIVKGLEGVEVKRFRGVRCRLAWGWGDVPVFG